MNAPKRNPYEDDNEVDYYVAKFNSEDFSERYIAISNLGWLKNKRAVEPLIRLLNSDDEHTQVEACRALGEIGDIRAVEPLITYYNATKKVVALEALGKLKDKQAISTLVEALKDKDVVQQQVAVEALGQIGGVEVVEPLLKVIKSKSPKYAHYQIKEKIADILGQIGEPAVLPLLKLLKSDNNDFRAYAVQALGLTKDKRALQPLIDALNNTALQVPKTAAKALGLLGYCEAIEPLTQVFLDTDYDSSFPRGKSFSYNLSVDSEALGLYKDLPRLVHTAMRVNALRALCLLNAENVLPLLIQALRDKSEAVQLNALAILNDFVIYEKLHNDETVFSELLKILMDKNLNKNLRREALTILGNRSMVSDQLFEPLAAIIQDENEDDSLRISAIRNVSKIKQKYVMNLLVETLKHNRKAFLRGEAAFGVANFNDADTIKALLEALEDTEISDSVITALGYTNNKRVFEPLLEAIEKSAIDHRVGLLGNFRDPRAIRILSKALENEKKHVRHYAALALSKIPDNYAIELLIKTLKDDDAWVRGWVVMWLGDVGDERAISELERIAKTDIGDIVDNNYQKVRIRDIAADAIEKIRQRMKDNQPQ